MKLPTFLDITNFVDNKGYTIIPHKQNNQWKVIVFKGEKYLGMSTATYKDGEDAKRKAYISYFNHLVSEYK